MTFVNVATMVSIFLGAMIASMWYYGTRGKKQIRAQFDILADKMGGTVTQRNRMHYPHWSTQVDERPVEIFFHLSEGHRKTSDIIYLVISTPISLPSATLVVEKDYFTVSPGKGSFNEVAGDFLADLMPGRYVYAADEEAAITLFQKGGLGERLQPLERYPNIVLGPDAITVGKPYGGPPDLNLERIRQDMESLIALADHLSAALTEKALAEG